MTPKGEGKEQPGSHGVTQEGPARERMPRAKAVGRGRAGNVPATGSRAAPLAPASRAKCQVQGWDLARGQWLHDRGQVSTARRPSRSRTADGSGLSPASPPPRAPTLAAATPTPSVIPTGKRGEKTRVWERSSPVQASRRASRRRGRLGTACEAGAAALPRSHHTAPARLIYGPRWGHGRSGRESGL